VTVKALYNGYTDWAKGAGEASITKKNLGQQLKERGFVPKHTKGGATWIGLRLRGPLEEDGEG
jgi:hypothetical protein